MVRHLGIKLTDQVITGRLDALGLVAKKAGAFDILFQFLLIDLDVVGGPAILSKKVFGYDVDPRVGALSGKNRGD